MLSPIHLSRLHLVTDRELGKESLVAEVAEAVRGGVEVVHLREPGLGAREVWSLACQLKEALRDKAALVVNDRLDVALAVGAEGVQLGGGSLPVAVAREIAGQRLAVGASVHGLEEAVKAEKDGADYLVLGTIYPSRSHPGRAGSGPALVREVTASVSIPVFAIGGLTRANVPEVLAAGAQGVAVISAILGQPDPAAAARALRQAIELSG